MANCRGLRIIAAALACCAYTFNWGEEACEAPDPGFVNLLDSVVKIDVWEESQSDGAKRLQRSVGSGSIMTPEGLVLTNAHVANDYAVKIIVTLSNLERVPAKLVGWDHWTDLALVQIDAESLARRGISLNCARLGDSDMLVPGQAVYAAGTPHGFARTVTRGIISNTSRFFEGSILGRGYETGNFNTWLQTDAAINPGNSGGPLALPNGDIIGINTRGYLGASGLGFAVPSNTAKFVMQKLLEDGRVQRSYIGISPDPLQDMEEFYELDANRGMLVRNVDRGSPAARAGILPGDIILKIGDCEVDGRFPEQLPAIMNSIAVLPVGTEVALTARRGRNNFECTVVTEPLESRVGREHSFEEWGVGVAEITTPRAREEKLDERAKLRITGLRTGFPFERADIYSGDIIVSVNRVKIGGLADLQKAYDEYAAKPEKLLVEVLRDHALSYHVVDPRNGSK